MQQPPHIDGLPLGWQIVISLIFGMAALGAAYSGYFKRGAKAVSASEPSSTAILAASITDGFATRSLNESVVRLDTTVQQLIQSLDENTHYARNHIEIDREMCGRLRELVEELERQGNDARRWDKRDEDRR